MQGAVLTCWFVKEQLNYSMALLVAFGEAETGATEGRDTGKSVNVSLSFVFVFLQWVCHFGGEEKPQ